MAKAVQRERAAAIRRARAALARLVVDDGERDGFEEAVRRYGDAVQLVADLRGVWVGLGSPVLAEGSMRQPIPHPLVKLIADGEAAAATHGKAVGVDLGSPRKSNGGAGGRPAGSASAPDRVGEPPRLTMVKSS